MAAKRKAAPKSRRVKNPKAKSRTGWTADARAKFLDAIRETGNVTEAARIVGRSRARAYGLRDDDPEFAKAWDEAEQEAADRLEREAWRRAVEGTDKPVTFQGAITATYKEYSDTLLIRLLEAHRPDKFKQRVANEHSGPNGGPIRVDYSALTDEELAAKFTALLGPKGDAS